MSDLEKALSTPVVSSEGEKEGLPVKEKWFDDLVEGVSRFPQGFFGISIFLARALLHEKEPPFAEFTQTRLDTNQLKSLADLGAKHHRAKGVILGKDYRARTDDDKEPNDFSVKHIWYTGAQSANERMTAVYNILLPYIRTTLPDMRSIDSPPVVERIRAVFDDYVSVLKSPKGTELSKEYIDAVSDQSNPKYKANLEWVDITTADSLCKLFEKKLAESFPRDVARRLSQVALSNDWLR